MTDRTEEIRRMAALMEERALQALRRDRAELARIRAEIDEIDRLRDAARDQAGMLGPARLAGADTAWQGWLLQKRAGLRRDEALARAQEDDSIRAARKAFGRRRAADMIADQEARDAARRRDRHAAEKAQAQALLGAWTPKP